MSPDTQTLTPVQQTVLAAIAGGATVKAAAEAAGIHRNTITYWRHTSQLFREALSHAQYDQAIFLHEEAQTRVGKAFAAIDAILANPISSPSTRLNAAKYIIEKASTPLPPEPETTYRIPVPVEYPVPAPVEAEPEPAPPTTVHTPPVHKNVNSPAQTQPATVVRTAPKVGRNEPCPCGSQLKFKRCCLGKPTLTMAA